ncbi:hypothetical protein KY284_035994 [Solanum tuberosum]|nr:hypothetical protein KY284_035994 [Solanum tuberosum]
MTELQQSSRTGRGEGRNSTTGNRSTTIRTSREVTPERSASPPPTLQKNATTRVVVSMSKAIENTDSSADPQSFLDGAFKALRALRCSSERSVEMAAYKLKDMANTCYAIVLRGRPTGGKKYATQFERLVQTLDMDVATYIAKLSPNMSTMTYSEAVDLAMKIEDKGQDERSAYDVCKKASTGGSYNSDLGANPKIGNQGRQQQGSQTWMDTVSQYTYKPHHRQGIQEQSSSQGHHNFGEMYLGHRIRDCPQPPRNPTQISAQIAAPTQTTHNDRMFKPQMQWLHIVKFEIPDDPTFILKGGKVPDVGKIISLMKA